MEYINAVNIITAIIVLFMFYFLKKIFSSDIGENRALYVLAFIVLGIGLYLWRSGSAAEIFANIFGTSK